MMIRVSLGISVVAFLFCSLAPAKTEQKAAAPTLTKKQWREDLAYFAKELPKRHKNLYHATPREQFERAVEELDAAIPSLQDHQIVVRLQQVAASVGDGHTGVHLPPYFKRYPLQLYWFGRELRVIAAARDYQKALGARVVKINDMPIDQVQARVQTCFPSAENENEWYVMGTSPAFLVVPEVLHALGVVSDPARAPFTFEDQSSKQFILEITPIAVQNTGSGPTIGMLAAATEQPLYRQKQGEKFWFTYLADTQTVYINFRGYSSLGKNAEQLFQFIDSHQTNRLIIDLRQNDGGDFFEGRKHMIQPVKKRPTVNQKGHLFVIIGRRTFSAAMVNAIDFRKETNAILVGEPIGERPNSYSENDELTLPNSGLVVSYSTRYYKFLEDDVPAVMPDKRIDPNWTEFQAGRDPVMEWILSSGSRSSDSPLKQRRLGQSGN